MKSLTEFLNNNNDELYEINEATDASLLTLLMTQIMTLTGVIIGIATADAITDDIHDESIIDIIKNWWKDRKAKGIAKKLAQDNDVQEFLRQPITKQRSGWRKLLHSKLDEKEFEYITRITKNSVKENIK